MAKIFYSWMSDGDEDLNKHFIWDCLERAIKRLNREGGIEAYEAVRDIRGARGMVDIVDEIFRRIDECDLIVADVSNIAANTSGELVPNPNVMFEFGYALARKGERALIGIANTAYGGPERLPFDINKRVIMTYELRDRADRARARDQLVLTLAHAIKTNLGEQQSERITRHSAGFAALVELLIGETDLPHVPDDASLTKRAARALELTREVRRSLHDLMDPAFAGFVVKTTEYLERALRMDPNEENLPKIRELLFWAYDDIELGSRDLRENLRMDDAGRERGLAAVRQLLTWFRESEAQASTLGGAELSPDDLSNYERKTFELRRVSFFGLLPSQPGFNEKLTTHSVSIRKEFLTLKVRDGNSIAQLARDAAGALDALLASYKV